MNATLIVVALPIGVAVMTYSLLRGEDLKLSTRMHGADRLAAQLLRTPRSVSR